MGHQTSRKTLNSSDECFPSTLVPWKGPTYGGLRLFFSPGWPSGAGGHYSRPQYLQDLFQFQFYLIAFLHCYVPHSMPAHVALEIIQLGAREGSFQRVQVTTTVWNIQKNTKMVIILLGHMGFTTSSLSVTPLSSVRVTFEALVFFCPWCLRA